MASPSPNHALSFELLAAAAAAAAFPVVGSVEPPLRPSSEPSGEAPKEPPGGPPGPVVGYKRKPWAVTLDELCAWREKQLAAGHDRWPTAMAEDPHERALVGTDLGQRAPPPIFFPTLSLALRASLVRQGKWLGNQRSSRRLLDEGPVTKIEIKNLKGMTVHRVRQLDERVPGWMRDEQIEVENGKQGWKKRRRKAYLGDGQNRNSNVTKLVRSTYEDSLARAKAWRDAHPDRWPIKQPEDGDKEEAKVYRWLVDQRRYRRNFEAGKTKKTGGMTTERLQELREVLGDDWYEGNKTSEGGSTARQIAKDLGVRDFKRKATGRGEGVIAGSDQRGLYAESDESAEGDGEESDDGANGTQPSANAGLDFMASLASQDMDDDEHDELGLLLAN